MNHTTGPNARFHGKVVGNRLELTITLIQTDEEIGVYLLELGKMGRVIKIM
ncbi:MAG: hypothetical protein QM785_19715 [Pyrinomonadaceae bacterium]